MRDILSAIEQLNEQPSFYELPNTGQGEAEMTHISKLQVGSESAHTEYSAYLGRHYLAAGFTPTESCQYLNILVSGAKEPIPYLVIPLHGGNLPWLESTALYLGSTPAITLSSCLSVGRALSIVSRYTQSLQQHARAIQLQIASLQTHLAKELAEAYVQLPALDRAMLTPPLELAEVYGKPPKTRKAKIQAGRFDQVKVCVPGLDGSSAQWVCEEGKWTIRGVRHQTERILQQAKCILDSGIVKGAKTPHECITLGLQATLYALKSTEQNISQIRTGLSRTKNVFKQLLPFVKSSPQHMAVWKISP